MTANTNMNVDSPLNGTALVLNVLNFLNETGKKRNIELECERTIDLYSI